MTFTKSRARETVREELRRIMQEAVDDDLLVWQVQSLRAQLMHNEMVAPGLTDSALLDAQYALLYRLIGEVLARAATIETKDGPKKRAGRNRNISEWEFRVFAIGSVDALKSLKTGRGRLRQAEKMVSDMAVAAGRPIGSSYFKNASALTKNFPKNTPVNIVITRKGIRDMLLKGEAAGEDIVELVRNGLELRARVRNLMDADMVKLAPMAGDKSCADFARPNKQPG